MADLSREFLEEVFAEAKKTLPKWVYAVMRRAAMSRAGGRARHRDDRPNSFEKIALNAIQPAALTDMAEDELRSVWSKLNQWHKSAVNRKRPTEPILKAASAAMAELQRRNLKYRETALSAEAAKGCKPEQAKKAAMPTNNRGWTTEQTIEQVVERKAKFSTEESSYVEPNEDPATVCGACRFFLRDPQAKGTCVVVEGEIAWSGGCELFIGAAEEARSILLSTKAKKTKEEILKSAGSVPTIGPQGAAIMFVGSSPGGIESARGEPMVGPAGETFRDLYLAPLKIAREEIAIAKAVPLLLTDGAQIREPTVDEVDDWKPWLNAELDRIKPGLVVALGEVASKALGDRADFKLPHPASVRRFGDSGEVGRKIKQIKKRIGQPHQATRPENTTVVITKADPVKRIVYGVVLDPYGEDGAQEDAHFDWTPPAEIEKAAHNYMKGKRVVGIQHMLKAVATVVESWVEKYPDPERENYLKAMQNVPHKVGRRKFGTDVLHSGSWVLGVELGQKEWQAYEDGILNAFSPAGSVIKTKMKRSDMPEVTFVDVIEQPA
jgi:uracil-DNA glycosylase family 4